MKQKDTQIEFTDTVETQKRTREIQLIINIVEPDPEYQPLFISDEAGLMDVTGYDEAECRRRLEFYLGRSFSFSVRQPLWCLVDEIKTSFPGWPEDLIQVH